MNWLITNIDTIFEIIGIAVTAGTGVVGLFSNKSWAKGLVKVCDFFSVVNTEKNKEIIKDALAKKKKK